MPHPKFIQILNRVSSKEHRGENYCNYYNELVALDEAGDVWIFEWSDVERKVMWVKQPQRQ